MDFQKIVVSTSVTAALAVVLVGQHCHLFPQDIQSVCKILTPHNLEAPDMGYPTTPSNPNRVSYMQGDTGAASATLPYLTPSPSAEA